MLVVDAITLFFVVQSGMSGSAYTRDVPGYSTENFLLANRIEAGVFVHRLHGAIIQNDRLAVAEAIRLPLRVNGPQSNQVRYYRTKSDVLRDYDRLFPAPVVDAIARQDLADLPMLDGNYMIGTGDIWFGQACLAKFCDEMGPFEIFAINRP